MDPIEIHSKIFGRKLTKGQLRKIQIIECAIECISTIGIHRTTFEAIGDRLEIPKAQVRYHFPNKDDIFRNAIQYITTCAQAITAEEVGKANDPEGRVLAVASGAYRWLEAYPQHGAVLALFYYLSTMDSDYREIHTEMRQTGRDRLIAILKPHLPPSQSREVAHLVQSIITSDLIECVTTSWEKTPHYRAYRDRSLNSVRNLLKPHKKSLGKRARKS